MGFVYLTNVVTTVCINLSFLTIDIDTPFNNGLGVSLDKLPMVVISVFTKPL